MTVELLATQAGSLAESDGWGTRPATAALSRTGRVLVIGESILNDAAFVAGLSPHAVDLRTYGGTPSPLGLLQVPESVLVYARGGNLLRRSDVAAWQYRTGVASVTATPSPATGKTVWEVALSGAAGQRINGGDDDAVYVPDPAPAALCFSVAFEPGTLKSVKLMLFNITTSAVLVSEAFDTSDSTDRGDLPRRAYVTATSGFSAGDKIYPYIYLGQSEGDIAGTAYLSEPLVNGDTIPAAYHATTGSAEALAAAAWLTPTPGSPVELSYDLAVIQFGRNDAGMLSAAQHADVLEGIIAGAMRRAARVMLATPPPLANAGLTAWEASDPYLDNGHLAAVQALALACNVPLYDAHSAFKASGYTVAQLMRDTVHPTVTGGAIGIGQYINAVANRLAAPYGAAPSTAAPPPQARLGGQPSGSWSRAGYTLATAPAYDAHGALVGWPRRTSVRALASSSAGDTLTTATITGAIIGLIVLIHSSSAGVVSVAVDGGAGVEVNLVGSGGDYYPRAFVIGAYERGEHTVVVTVTSGQARVVGVVAC